LLRLDDEQAAREVSLAAADLALAKGQLQRLLNGAHEKQKDEAAALCRAKQAELERAELDWKRAEELHRTKTISTKEADNQRTLVTALKNEAAAAKARLEFLEAKARPDEVGIEWARVQAAEARYELAKIQLDRTRLCAPRGGQVLKINVEPGEMAGPASAEAAVIVADTSKFRVRAFVEELDAPRVVAGMAAKVTADGLPGPELRGRVVRLSPRMDRKSLSTDRAAERFDTKTREVWIELEPGQQLVVGLRVDVVLDVPPGS
jgi:HlyD family secretion protein